MTSINTATELFYHVLIETNEYEVIDKKKSNKEYIGFDYSYDSLIENVVKPFNSKQGTVKVDGYHLDHQIIRRLLIRLSTLNSNDIKTRFKENLAQKANNLAARGIFANPIVRSKDVLLSNDYSCDVTEELTLKYKSQQVNVSEATHGEINKNTSRKKYFISHSVKDKNYATCVMELLEAMGVNQDDIFCCSAGGNGIPIGQDWKEFLQNELNSNTFVIFLLSENFYKSPICLCEMGAAWILTKNHALILIPPFEYGELKGIITTQGFKIDDDLSWTLLMKQLEFDQDQVIWERKRNSILKRLESLIAQ